MPKLIDLTGGENQQTISTSELKDSISRYKSERLDLLPGKLTEGARAVWISKKKILQFFADNPGATGARFYHGVIEDPQVKEGVHNLIVVPTTANGQVHDDLAGDEDSVLVTHSPGAQTRSAAMPAGSVHTLICPPPIKHCQGTSLL